LAVARISFLRNPGRIPRLIEGAQSGLRALLDRISEELTSGAKRLFGGYRSHGRGAMEKIVLLCLIMVVIAAFAEIHPAANASR
jgi:hypothetical protein